MRNVARTVAVLVAMSLVGACSQLQKEMNSASTSADQQIAQKRAELPHCARPAGTVAIAPPEQNWWREKHLQSPEALLKFLVASSNCFTVLDRGRGFDIAERERAIAAGGELRRGANIGKGQVVAADYVIVPDIVSANKNSGGTAIVGLLGAFVPGVGGALLGGLQLTDHSADVSLSITDVRSSQTVAMTEGHAEKSDLGFGAAGVGVGVGPGGAAFGGAAVSSYQNTEIGKVVMQAYIDAYAKMVPQVAGTVSTNAAATNTQEAFQVTQPGHLFKQASAKSGAIKEVSPGTLLYPTGVQEGAWHQVKDEFGAQGWVAEQIITKRAR